MFNFFTSFFENKPFKKLVLEIHMTDGSIEKTDPITYKKFKELVDARIQGEEIRKARQEDYAEAYETFVELCEKPYLSDYFSVSIRGKTIDIPSTNIIEIKKHEK